MSQRGQAATIIALLLALLTGLIIIQVSPIEEVGTTLWVYPGNSTKVLTQVTVNNGMLINITDSYCNITSPNGTSMFLSPMSPEGYKIQSPYTNCLPITSLSPEITPIKTNITYGAPDAGGFNTSVFEMDNSFIKVKFSPADTIRIFKNESGNFTQLLRLGFKSEFFIGPNSSWDNRTSAGFIDTAGSTTLRINFTSTNYTLDYNITLYEEDSSLVFDLEIKNITRPFEHGYGHVDSWYPENYFNLSHPSYTWPQIVRYYDSYYSGFIFNSSTGPLSSKNNSTGLGYFELWDLNKERTSVSITVSYLGYWNIEVTPDPWDAQSFRWEMFRIFGPWYSEYPYKTSSYSITFLYDPFKSCIGSGTFNMTCNYVPYEAGNHSLNTTINYYYVNVTDPKYNGTFTLSELKWFNVSSEPGAGCEETAGCDSCMNKLNNEACDCNDECQSSHCVHGICRSSDPFCGDGYCDSGEDCASCSGDCGSCGGGLPPGGGGIPPPPSGDGTEEPGEPDMEVSAPNIVVLYMNETTQFRIDVENTGDLELNNVRITPETSNTSLRIVPTYYSFINVSELRIFLVDATPTALFNETVTFNISSNLMWKTVDVPFVVFPAREFVNVSELVSEKNRLKELIADTEFILNSLLEAQYDVQVLIENLDDADENLTEAEQMIHQERYTDAKSILDQIPIMVEDIYTAMEQLRRLPGAPFFGSGFMLILLIVMVIVSAVIFLYIIFVYKRMPGH